MEIEMEASSSSTLWAYVVVILHFPPTFFIAQLVPLDVYIKFFTVAFVLFTLYVVSLLIGTNTAANLKSCTLKSGTYLTKSSLTLNDLRIIKYRNLFGTSGDKMTKTTLIENNRKIMSQTIADDKEKLNGSGGSKSGMSRSASHHQKFELMKLNDNVVDQSFVQSKAEVGKSGAGGAGGAGAGSAGGGVSFKMKSSQVVATASLLTIVIKKWKRS